MFNLHLAEGNRSFTLVMLASILSSRTYSVPMFSITCQESVAKNAEGRRDSQTFGAQLRADAAAMGPRSPPGLTCAGATGKLAASVRQPESTGGQAAHGTRAVLM